MKMKFQAALAIIVVVVYIASDTFPVSAACTYVDHTTDKCRNADVVVGNKIFKKGSYDQINLSNPQNQIFWHCGSSRERTAWRGWANRLNIYFSHDGTIFWWIYRCRRCTIVERTSDRCRSASYIWLLGQRIYKNTFGRVVKLPSPLKQVYWYCGSSRERTAWGPQANELSVSYFSDGRIAWEIKKCN